MVGKRRVARSVQNIFDPIIILNFPAFTFEIIFRAAFSGGIPFFSRNLASFFNLISSICLLFNNNPVLSGGGITIETLTVVSSNSVLREFVKPITALLDEQ